MRLTGLAHGVYEDAMDYSVFAGAWNIGRIYGRRGCSDAVRFFWSLHGVVLTRPPEFTPTVTSPPSTWQRRGSSGAGIGGWHGRNGQRLNDEA